MITCTCRILRYAPALTRDEWINVGLLFLNPAENHLRFRLLEEPAELARLRRVHPDADASLLRGVEHEFAAQRARYAGDSQAALAALENTMSNSLQLSPEKAVLTDDPAAELERLYAEHVAPPTRMRRAAAADVASRPGLRAFAAEVFRSAGLWPRLETNVRVAEFTYPGDPSRLDFAYRRNGTRGFIQAVPLLRDSAQVKSLAFTADAIRLRQAAEFHAVTETAPPADGRRYAETADFLRRMKIEVVPASALNIFAGRLRAQMP
jgi:hypothetical protein